MAINLWAQIQHWTITFCYHELKVSGKMTVVLQNIYLTLTTGGQCLS
jgi:hypothetical protein